MNERSELEKAIDEPIDFIDQTLALNGVPLHSRPLYAAIQYVKLYVVKVRLPDLKEISPNKIADHADSDWFRSIFKTTENWYRHRYGELSHSHNSNKMHAATLVRDTPYLLTIPMTTSEVEKPGESAWLCFPDTVQKSEDVLSWIQHGPNFDNLSPKDVIAARKLAEGISIKLRLTCNTLRLGLDPSETKLLEMSRHILPNLEEAASFFVKNGQLAFWPMQMACELALKCLAQQRSKEFKETHDLYYLFDQMPDGVPPFPRKLLSRLPNWEEMVQLRYGGGKTFTIRQTFRAYQATIDIVQATTSALKKHLYMKNAKFLLKFPPYMKD